jgi:hypothetical protein
MMRQSCARLAGAVDGLVDLDDAPSTCVTVPSSSSCKLPGSTMSAWRAVSLRKKSIAT